MDCAEQSTGSSEMTVNGNGSVNRIDLAFTAELPLQVPGEEVLRASRSDYIVKKSSPCTHNVNPVWWYRNGN